MKHQVFISYSAMDKPVAAAICEVLERRGTLCWIAPRDVCPGEDWSGAIIDAITECRLFLLILSSNSNVSEQVKREVQNAVSESKILLPLRVEDVALSKHMRYFIGTPHWLDALPPPIDSHLDKIAGTIQTLLGDGDEQARQEAMGAVAVAEVVYAAPNAQPGRAHAQPPSISPEQIKSAVQLLARQIGPMASVFAKRAAREASNLEDFHARLAAECPSEREKKEFLKAVK